MADKNTTDRDIFRLRSRRLQKRVRCQSTIFSRSLFGRELEPAAASSWGLQLEVRVKGFDSKPLVIVDALPLCMAANAIHKSEPLKDAELFGELPDLLAELRPLAVHIHQARLRTFVSPKR